MTFGRETAEAVSIVQWRIVDWFPEISAQTRVLLKRYHEELIKANRTTPLIGVKTIPAADAIHFADSLLACKAIEKDLKFNEIYDFGSGSGFPGLVMAVMLPDRQFVLVESDGKKAEFLKQTAQVLGLKNVKVLARTVEGLPEGSVKCAVARGFANLSRSVLTTRRIIPVGGTFYHLKGEEWATEISDIPTQLCSFWLPSLLTHYRLPVGEIRFAVVKTEKTKA